MNRDLPLPIRMPAESSEPLLRDAVRVIQDAVTETTGSPLHREAIKRIESALKRIAEATTPPIDTGYSRREATILFADMRGFSAISAAYPPAMVLALLNSCFGLLTEIIARHFGTVDKFIGDAVMAVFHGERGHACRAVLCAVEMQLAMSELCARHRAQVLPEIYVGIGISSGPVMTGLIGSNAYRAYTVIGEEVNLASRIEAFSLRGQVLMSESTYRYCADFVQAGERMEIYVKGRRECLHIREALAIPSLGKVVPRQDQRKSPRVPVEIEVECRAVNAKVAGAEAMRATMRDLGYYGARLELSEALPLYSEVQLAFELPHVASRIDDIYARVVSVREMDGRNVAGVEFTSLGAQTSKDLRRCVQMQLQGEGSKNPLPLPLSLTQGT